MEHEPLCTCLKKKLTARNGYMKEQNNKLSQLFSSISSCYSIEKTESFCFNVITHKGWSNLFNDFNFIWVHIFNKFNGIGFQIAFIHFLKLLEKQNILSFESFNLFFNITLWCCTRGTDKSCISKNTALITQKNDTALEVWKTQKIK